MKILLVGPNIYEKNKLGGIITVVKQIESSIKNISYFSRSPKTRKLQVFNYLFLIVIFIRFSFAVRKNIKLVHINTAFENTALIRDLILCKISKFHNKKIVLHIHGGKYFTFTPSVKKKKLIQDMINCANNIIVLSAKEKEIIQDKYKCPPIFILGNAVEIPQNLNIHQKSFKTLNFIYLGRVAPDKGLEDILDALKILQKENISFNYKVYGNGPMLDNYIKECKVQLGNSFIYGGVVQNNAKWQAFGESNVFLLPSLYEGLPMSLLEAMATGNICITTKVGSIPDVVKDNENGYFVSKNSAEEIANVSKLIMKNNSKSLEISEQAIKTIKNSFNLDNYNKKLTDIYNT